MFIFITSPLEQFEVYTVLNLFTNLQLYAFLAVAILSFWWYATITRGTFLATNVWSAATTLLQEQLMILVGRNIGGAGQPYYPFLVVLFLFLLVLNLVGMIPYTFTVTSHIIVTLALSFTFFFGTNLRAVLDMKWGFFGLFLPSGAPVAIMPFLIVVEVISYFARVASLAIRLFANMMAGHSLLKILIGFVYSIFFFDTVGLILGWVPFLLVFVITFLEAGVALVQAYVFTILLCIYIKDLYVAH
jgi:ATP synthase subunit 6